MVLNAIRYILPRSIKNLILGMDPILFGTGGGLVAPRVPLYIAKYLKTLYKDPLFYFYATGLDCIKEIYEENIYEKYKKIEPGDNVVDVGANVGMFTLRAAKLVGTNGKVLSIEPSDDNTALLKKNIYVNGYTNISLIKKALTDYKGIGTLILSSGSATHSLASVINARPKTNGAVNETEMKIEVEVDTLDNIIMVSGLDTIDLLKIDVEGAEEQVLRGAKSSLMIAKNISMELHYDNEVEYLIKFLEEKGFSVYILGNMLYAKRALSLSQ